MRLTLAGFGASALFLVLLLACAHAEEVFGARFPAPSPDGTQVSFEYWGDIWIAPVDGSLPARRLTDHRAFDRTPVFSPDGAEVAFASDRSGSQDIWVLPVQGGVARQVTSHSNGESLCGWSPDGKRIAYLSNLGLWSTDLWHVDTQGQTPPVQVTQGDYQNIQSAVMLPDGSFVVSRGGGVWWRKNYRGTAQTDLWRYTPGAPSQQLTTHRGYDEWPMASPNGQTIYYVTDEDGIANIWRMDLATSEKSQLTRHTTDGVQFPRISADGRTIAYEFEGWLYTVDTSGGEPRKLSLTIAAEPKDNWVTKRSWRDSATEYAVSPHGKYIVVVIEGDLWAIRDPEVYEKDKKPDQDLELSTRLTASDGARERNPVFLDNTRLVYASDADGDYELYLLDLKTLETKQLTDNSYDDLQPQADPANSNVIFWYAGNLELRRMELDTLVQTVVAQGSFRGGFDYPEYQVSPDGRWVVYTMELPNWTSDLFIAPADGSSAAVNITRHPDWEGDARWSPDGKRLLYTAQRHDQRGVYVVDLVPQAETYDLTFLFDDDLAAKAEAKPADGKDDESAGDDAGSAAGDETDGSSATSDDEQAEKKDKDQDESKAEEKPKDEKVKVEIDFKDIHLRARQVSTQSNAAGGIFSEDGAWVAYTAYPEQGGPQAWAVKTKGGDERKLFDGGLSQLSQIKEKRIYHRDGGPVLYFRFEDGEARDRKEVHAKGEFWLDQRARWRQMYREAWQTLGQRFYDPAMHGVDWNAVYAKYLPCLDHIGTPEEFAWMFEEVMGELNGSHLAISTGSSYSTDARVSCSPGLEFDPAFDGPGLKVTHVTYQGPADQPGVDLAPGDVVLRIEDTPVDRTMDWSELLRDHQDQPTRFAVQDGEDGSEREVALKPVTYGRYQELLYREWEIANENTVAELSGGRIGYIHIQQMSGGELRKFEREFFSEVFEKDALIVDVRFNPGGFIHEELFDLLDRNIFGFAQSGRDTPWIPQPSRAFLKPKALLINSRSGSDAEIFPAGWRALNLGPIIGEDTAGAVIGTTGFTLIDGSWVRLPINGWYELSGRDLELSGTPPDILVNVNPDELRQGYDAQLRKAVEVLLAELQKEEPGD